MNRLLAVLTVLAVVLAGCAVVDPQETPGPDEQQTPGPGEPQEIPDVRPLGPFGRTVAPDDCVIVEYQAYDPANGRLLDQGYVFFLLGRNISGLGADVEVALPGLRVNQTVEVHSTDDTGRSAGEVTMQRLFGPRPLEEDWTMEVFLMHNDWFDLENATGGEFIHVHNWYDGEYVSHNETHVRVRYTPTEDQRYHRLGHYPMAIETRVDEAAGTWSEVRVADDVGVTFTIEPAPQQSCWTDFHLPPGEYTVRDWDETLMYLDARPAIDLPGEIVFHVAVAEIHELPEW